MKNYLFGFRFHNYLFLHGWIVTSIVTRKITSLHFDFIVKKNYTLHIFPPLKKMISLDSFSNCDVLYPSLFLGEIKNN